MTRYSVTYAGTSTRRIPSLRANGHPLRMGRLTSTISVSSLPFPLSCICNIPMSLEVRLMAPETKLVVRSYLLEGTISRGLELLHTVFFTIRDHSHLVSTMQKQICYTCGPFLGNAALDHSARYLGIYGPQSERDHKAERREPLTFEGDGEPDSDGPGPPLAWTLIWGGTYSNLYGYYVPDIIRRWGYVMWDAARLEHTHANELLMRQWEAEYGDWDPRDSSC